MNDAKNDRRITRRRRLAIGGLVVAATLTAGVQPATAATPNCFVVDTVVQGTVSPTGASSAPIHHSRLDGTITATFTPIRQIGNITTVSSVGEIVTSEGSIFIRTAGLLRQNGSETVFAAAGPVTGGTGVFAAASGALAADGTVSATGTFHERIRAAICTP